MRYRALDQNGDYSFGQGSQNFLIDSRQGVAQAVLTALRLFQGEWFLDSTAGVPWFTEVVGYGTQGIYDNVIKAAVLQVQGVLDLQNYASNLNRITRELTITMDLDTQFGQVTITSTLLIPTGYGVGPYGVQLYGV